ncbi:MAG: DEAD/DEAH box helicase, partial [Nanoarchaeota archaeon]|nr:DEAD/DEAH box helicase [Nanoarchaeota archaeon]
VEAIEHIEANRSVVVSAATGTGKTLIADYTIAKFLNQKRRVIYTAPIKALSNQKYKDFCQDYGKEFVGMMTGDVVINPDAPMLVMTTEIYRNMLLAKDPIIDYLSYVIFDEIHFISDIERGTVWEESIIFSPNRIRFLCLSATIPNALEFAEWISEIKEHEVRVVEYLKRAVPLTHHLFEKTLGVCTIDEVREIQSIPEDRRNRKVREFPASHLDLISAITDKTPCIFFSFSRKKCEKFAHELAKQRRFTSQAQRGVIAEYISQNTSPEVKQMASYQRLRECLEKGVAYHHAGLLPNLKEVVERLFEKGLISVLYATDTFAVGVNMPAKAVCFDALEKFDGVMFRYLSSKEYFQCAGRAGRRGIDTEGNVYAIVDRKYTDLNKIARLTSKDTEPIISQFRLSYNTVLNLCKNHPSEEEIDIILRSNFDAFLRKKKEPDARIKASFNNKVRELQKMGYLMDGRKLTPKGEFATHIYFNELLISEIFSSQMYQHLSSVDISCLVAGIVYEERRADEFKVGGAKKQYEHLLHVLSKNPYVEKNINKHSLLRLMMLVSRWAQGATFTELLLYSNLLEGDIIRLFRRMIDIMKQISKATRDMELQTKMRECMKLIDRDIVKSEFTA